MGGRMADRDTRRAADPDDRSDSIILRLLFNDYGALRWIWIYVVVVFTSVAAAILMGWVG